jgi:hypothetical protein
VGAQVRLVNCGGFAFNVSQFEIQLKRVILGVAVTERIFPLDGGPATPEETASYAAQMAHELTLLCEQAGLVGLATLFYAASGEAERAVARLTRQDPTHRRHG